MGLSQAMSTGISGLITHQKAMDNIGNNLANVNTTGFKKGVFQFRTMLEQTLRGGMGADNGTGRGSINPVALGLGTQTGSINKVFTQGPLENTANPNDMALMGNGFFVLGQGNGYVLTRDGSFYIGADGSLMGGNGLFVQGTMAMKSSDGSMAIPQDAKLQSVKIPIGETGGMSQTSKVEFKGNLNSDQQVSTGLRLFGGTSYPTVSNLQQWMWNDFNGGNPTIDNKVDTTWSSLELPQAPTYNISESTWRMFSGRPGATNPAIVPDTITIVSDREAITFDPDDLMLPDAGINGEFFAYAFLDIASGQIIEVPVTVATGLVDPILVDAAWYALPANLDLVPLVEEVKTINGGNVQTSASYALNVPNFLRGATASFEYIDPNTGERTQVNNDYTYPPWFYEATGATTFEYPAASGNYVSAFEYVADQINAFFDPALSSAAAVDANIRSIWPNGINGVEWPVGVLLNEQNLPHVGETYPASLSTPLEHLSYQKGNTWVQPFANIKDGDDITITFRKGNSQVEATFTYNRPSPLPMNQPQQPLDIEKSYTLEHFLKFLAGDVDEPSIACDRITPAMFGAAVTDEYPEGNPYSLVGEGLTAYTAAMQDVMLAKNSRNLDTVGGAMGLLSLPPQISSMDFGPDAYDAPLESAGAYTREGVSQVYYNRWDPTENRMKQVLGTSFNTSFVANLGEMNALSDIRVSFNNVPHESMYSAETKYSAPQGGSAVASMTFYDSLGNPKEATIRLAMVDQDTDFTTWRWYADCVQDTDFPWQVDPSTGEITSNLNVGTGLIRFDKNGNFVAGAEYTESGGITINQEQQGVNEPIVIRILNGLAPNIPQDLNFSFLTMSATESDFTLKAQNGAPPGVLESYQVSLDGLIQGLYSNGVVAPIARLILALIPNQNGLVAAGDNLYYVGPASGDAQYGYANLGGRAEIRQSQLETSNVDLSEEFTKMITIERGFQANSRTVTTADEMLQELLNLKR
ncbi:MAG: flagellar hook-basal body complex protein [Planctomycetota bacterium]|jgi:flagellar hook-basal body protein|nr:flagellar hook-basal body complex protein [Planctomycetota bacterium]